MNNAEHLCLINQPVNNYFIRNIKNQCDKVYDNQVQNVCLSQVLYQ